MSASREFQRIVSLKAFLKPGFGLALAAAFVAAMLLMVALLCAAASVGVSIQGLPGASVAGPAGEGLSARFLAALGTRMPPMPSLRSGLLVLLSTAGLAYVVSRLLTTWSLGQCARSVAAVIQRQRQHLHRKAIRLEPADVTGEQSDLLDRLFRESAQQLEDRAIAWAQVVCQRSPEVLLALALGCATGWQTALQTSIPLILGRFLLQRQQQQVSTSTQLLAEQATRGLRRMTESLRKARLVSSFGMEQHEQQQFELQLVAWRGKNEQLRTQQAAGDLQRQLVLLISVGIPFVILCLRLQAGLPLADGILMGLVLLVMAVALRDLAQLPELASE
ncbi:MAG: hypothetical protein ACKOEO_04470, partial [Planctomycetaceae bacterium]